MDDEKRKAERHFNEQAIREAVKRMRPELEAASEAAHKMKNSEDSGDDQDYRDFDRTVELGYFASLTLKPEHSRVNCKRHDTLAVTGTPLG
jgi:hypothetical protein